MQVGLFFGFQHDALRRMFFSAYYSLNSASAVSAQKNNFKRYQSVQSPYIVDYPWGRYLTPTFYVTAAIIPPHPANIEQLNDTFEKIVIFYRILYLLFVKLTALRVYMYMLHLPFDICNAANISVHIAYRRNVA